MAWKETCVMEQKKAFIQEYLTGKGNLKALCEKYGISEKTGHKWKNRFLEHGYEGLIDQSRAPENSPTQLDEDTVIRLIRLRTAHPTWGPKKLAVLYKKAYPQTNVPSESSIYRVLGKAGLIKKRRIRHVENDTARLRNRIPASQPNDVWTVDFKGWWYSSGEKCIPLTVRDLASRYILTIRLMQSCTAEAVREVFEQLFYKYGLPKVIRSDNGIPFATTSGLCGLTILSAWWIYLGIMPDRTDPGSPGQNGSHERMHADLSREIQGKIHGGISANQCAIDAWMEEYNEQRPHEALAMKTPAEVYRKSDVPYDGTPEMLEYPMAFLNRKVNKNGYVKLDKRQYMVSTSLRGLTVGLQQNESDEYVVWLGEFPLGAIVPENGCFTRFEKLQ